MPFVSMVMTGGAIGRVRMPVTSTREDVPELPAAVRLLKNFRVCQGLYEMARNLFRPRESGIGHTWFLTVEGRTSR